MKKYAEKYNLPELMCVAAAREIPDGDNVLTGLGLPLLVLTLAKLLSAPNIKYATEVGAFDWEPGPDPVAPVSVGDPILFINPAMLGDMGESLGCSLMGGRFDLAFLGAAQIDKFGNLNTIALGDYHSPFIKLGGTGGNTDAACLVKKVITIIPHGPYRFVKRPDFLSSPGYLDGPGGRERAGLRPQGPNTVISTMGVLRFDTTDGGRSGTCEMYLDAVFPGVSVTRVKENTGWDLKVAPRVKEVEPPSQEEVDLLRKLDYMRMFLREGRYD